MPEVMVWRDSLERGTGELSMEIETSRVLFGVMAAQRVLTQHYCNLHVNKSKVLGILEAGS